MQHGLKTVVGRGTLYQLYRFV